MCVCVCVCVGGRHYGYMSLSVCVCVRVSECVCYYSMKRPPIISTMAEVKQKLALLEVSTTMY